MAETEKNIEEEKNPEQVMGNAVTAVENKDAADPVISSGWAEGIKKFWKDEEGANSVDSAKALGKMGEISLAVGLFASYKILRGVFEFTKKAVQKKGQVGFGEGYEIGKEMFSFENKKDKK